VNWDDTIIDAAATDTGMRRSNNQDAHVAVRARTPEVWRKRGHVFMVADGMGAHAVGELASKLACDNIPHNYGKLKLDSAAEALTRAYREVAQLIHSKASANRDFEGMGTTASTLVLGPAGAMIAHVGDSRVYRIRDERIEQLTFDHSLVWELVRRQHMTLEQAERSLPRNVITRSLGPDPAIEVDVIGPIAVEPGDVFLLCSDGLSGPVGNHELGVFASQFHPKTASKYLLHLANLRGGHDNITVMIVRIGPFHDPADPNAQPEPLGNGASQAAKAPSARQRGFSFGNLLNAFQQRKPLPTVEPEIHQACDCPVNAAVLNRLAETVREGQAFAVEQAWPVDWAALTASKRAAEEAKAAGNLREALRHLGEAILRLGVSGRVHRKEQVANGAHPR